MEDVLEKTHNESSGWFQNKMTSSLHATDYFLLGRLVIFWAAFKKKTLYPNSTAGI